MSAHPRRHFACNRVRVWRGCSNVDDVGIAETCETRSMDTVLSMLFSCMLTVCSWTMIARNGPIMVPNNLLLVPVTNANASQSVDTSGVLARSIISCSLNEGFFHLRQP